MSGGSGNCVNSGALQELSPLLVGVNPGGASSASTSWDSSNREGSGQGQPGPGVPFPWSSSPAVPAPGGSSLGVSRSGSSENRESAILEQSSLISQAKD